jgi:hypothetical protein
VWCNDRFGSTNGTHGPEIQLPFSRQQRALLGRAVLRQGRALRKPPVTRLVPCQHLYAGRRTGCRITACYSFVSRPGGLQLSPFFALRDQWTLGHCRQFKQAAGIFRFQALAYNRRTVSRIATRPPRGGFGNHPSACRIEAAFLASVAAFRALPTFLSVLLDF